MIAYRARHSALKHTSSSAVADCVAEAISLNFKLHARRSPRSRTRGTSKATSAAHSGWVRAHQTARRRNLLHRSRAAARLLRVFRHARPRVCRRSHRRGKTSHVDWPTSGRAKSTSPAATAIGVQARPGPPLSHADRARNRQTSRRVPRISDAARTQSPPRVPKSIPTEHAVFIEPVAAACEILDQIKIPKAERIARCSATEN